ncbi:PREDICTED: contactin-1a-like isoform X2 [Cyprinodon variegatus]|uniref:contactin-1a-like isoform X2 n=1 Tax=Cyprinodon variegatus TaxID=28743 RepID=UPI000742562A|nr:PREDICTED: contactin-1a-like isoform X2 [Cyprinodon variegatus]
MPLPLHLSRKPRGPAHVSSSRFLAVTPPGGSSFNTMLCSALLLHLLAFSLADPLDQGAVLEPFEDDATGFGPVFVEQPVDTIYPEESPEAKIIMTCEARANPPATYRWKLNNTDIDVNKHGSHYSLSRGNLIISNPLRTEHVGKYSCLATNMYGTVVSQEASVQFGYLDLFSSEERHAVHVKEGQGAVLLCFPPAHYPGQLSFRWILNEFPKFILLDKRHFVSQLTGNLYISKVESSDRGNYSCMASSPSISKSVFSNYIPLKPSVERPIRKYPADLRVKFPHTTALVGQDIILECFALGNPVPEIRWKRVDGKLPDNHQVRMAGAQLYLPNVQFDDSGIYSCEAVNSKGKDHHHANVSVEAHPEWVEHIVDTEKDLYSDYTMSCIAKGVPKPHIRWLKNGEPQSGKELRFSRLTTNDAGMYQCIAENRHGIIYANAELRVFYGAPKFPHSPIKRVLAPKNGRAVIECRPKAAPKPTLTWSKETELLSNSSRVLIWEDGSLEILNVTPADEGSYTCFAENDWGKANNTLPLVVTESTKITLAPSNADIHAGDDTWMECAASYDPSVDITFIWSLNGRVIDLHKENTHYESILNGSSNSKLLIKKAQLRHGGQYTCTAKTQVDNATASAHLLVRGPPGAPGGVRIAHKSDRNVTLQWSRGADNHSPISKYTIQYRDQFSKDVWKIATTSPADVEGNAETATVVDLFPWTEYEFRVIATNTLGTGEPSRPSQKETTLESVPVVAPSNVDGGGGASRELTITWTPVQPQYYFGSNFGYIVAFKPLEEKEWNRVKVTDPGAKRYVYKDPKLKPMTKFEVKVKAFNSQGEGPYSITAIIYSAQDPPSEAPEAVEGKALSATAASVSWLLQSDTGIDGYQVKYWRQNQESESLTVRASPKENHTRLEGLKPSSDYIIEIRGYNSAGYGPPSKPIKIRTKKPPPDRPPKKIVATKLKEKYVNVSWEAVEPFSNESIIESYRVLCKLKGNINSTLYTTKTPYIGLQLDTDKEYVVEVRVHTEGGDGAVAQISIPQSYSRATWCSPFLNVLPMLLLGLLLLNL